MQLQEILQTAHKHDASDIHIVSGHPPIMRVHTVMTPMEAPILTPSTVEQFLGQMITQEQLKRFAKDMDLDFSFEVQHLGRYRVNAHLQRGTVGLAMRIIKTQVPLKVTPVPFGNSSKLAHREPVLIAGWGGVPDTALAYVVSRRPFSASWEYMLDEAIFTSPPTTGWSGAALVDRKGTIVGVGSLVVRDATVDEPKLPGNMFVPIDALKPISVESAVRPMKRVHQSMPSSGNSSPSRPAMLRRAQ